MAQHQQQRIYHSKLPAQVQFINFKKAQKQQD